MNIFSSLEIGRRALFASRLSLDVAGNNIANVNTPGFTRRRAELVEMPPLFTGRYFIGTGVDSARVTRVVDSLLDAQLRGEEEGVGRHGAASEGLSKIEQILGEGENGGISAALSEFYSAFSGLAGSADDPSLRRSVASKADALAAAIRTRAAGLAGVRSQADAEAAAAVSRITALSKDIADLNRKIQISEPGGAEAGELRDARAVALRELSGLVDIHVADGPRGSLYVSLAGTGDTLVGEAIAYSPTLTRDSNGYARVLVSRGGVSVDVTDRIRGGKLGGLLGLRDGTAKTYADRLDAVASDLIARVNALHTAGKDLSGADGGNFFVPTAPGASAAATLSVSAAILSDPSLIAAATTASVGDGSNALAIAGLAQATSASLGGRTTSGYLADIQTQLGIESQTSSSALETGRSALLAAEERIQSISGVDLDEEATALIQYQRSYEAAAKFISVVNEMTKTALDIFTTA